jgi:hypothetical protein
MTVTMGNDASTTVLTSATTGTAGTAGDYAATTGRFVVYIWQSLSTSGPLSWLSPLLMLAIVNIGHHLSRFCC